MPINELIYGNVNNSVIALLEAIMVSLLITKIKIVFSLNIEKY